MRINISIDPDNSFLFDPLKEYSELKTDPCLVEFDLKKRVFGFEGSFEQIRKSFDEIITRYPILAHVMETIWKKSIITKVDVQSKDGHNYNINFDPPSIWIISELGDPDDPSWEISVVKRDREDLINSYGWGGEDKHIIHYAKEPVHPIVVIELRKAAAAILDKFNN